MHVSATCAACVQHDPEDQLNYACVQQGLKLSNHPVTDTRVCRSIQHVTICSKATTIRIRSRAGLFRKSLASDISGNILRGWQVGQALSTSFALHVSSI